MSEHFTPEEIEQFDVTRFALFIKYSRAGRPKEVAGLLAKTMMPHVDGLPTNAEQLVRQKLLADVIGKSAEDADDESLLFGISKVAEVLAVNATDEDAEVYWTGILADTVTELSKRVGASRPLRFVGFLSRSRVPLRPSSPVPRGIPT